MLKHSVFAVRMAGATSFGSEKYSTISEGSTTGCLPASTRNSQPSEPEFAYQTIATKYAGFDLNIRNGNSYLLMNAEARIPIFKMLLEPHPFALLPQLPDGGFLTWEQPGRQRPVQYG